MLYIRSSVNYKRNTAKHILFLIISIVLSIVPEEVSAQNSKSSSQILSAMVGKIRSTPSVKMEFEFLAVDKLGLQNPARENYSGSVTASGDFYKLYNSNFELFCDGETKWMVNHSEGEVTIFHHDPGQTDIVENPMGFFTTVESAYNFPERAKSEIIKSVSPSVNGQQVWSIELKPKNKRAPYKEIVLSINSATNQPTLVKYTSRDNSVYIVVIKEFKSLPQQLPKSIFTPPSPLPPGYKTNDLR